MARLKMLGSQVSNLRPAVSMLQRQQAASWQRDNPEERAFYKTARWQRLRMQVLIRDLFTCQWPGCGRVVAQTSQLVADHIIPVRADPSLKWDESNLRCLCAACHNGPRQAEEVALYGRPGEGGSKV
jgi:5-methylcytosine-specific restriction endonuclease McrA